MPGGSREAPPLGGGNRYRERAPGGRGLSPMLQYGIVVHGGVGTAPSENDGCRAAAEAGRAVLEKGGDAPEAAVRAAVVLENDGRYNAGSGAVFRLDGKTIEMDASLMTSDLRLGIVAGIARVKNPILVAR